MRGERGFTLLETLLVLGIVGVLFTLAFSTYARESRVAAIRADVATLGAALETARSNSIRYNLTQRVKFTGRAITTTATGRPDKAVLLETCSVQGGLPELRWNAPLAEFSTAINSQPGGVEINLTCPNETRTVKVIGVTGKVYY